MEEDKLEKRYEIIEVLLGMIIDHQRKNEEYLLTILHAVCESNDQKTSDSIRKYLKSEFRNNRNIL